MGGKRKPKDNEWETDPFVLNHLERKLAPSPTREIMFSFLAKDRKTALTPSELMEQTRNIRLLLGKIDFALQRWTGGGEEYAKLLKGIDWEIGKTNIANRCVRDRAEDVIRERQYAALEAKIKAVPKVGLELVDSAARSRDS